MYGWQKSKNEHVLYDQDDLTPEVTLWVSVLSTYIQDAKSIRGGNVICSERRGIFVTRDSLLYSLYNKWTRTICELIGVDYEWFVERVETILNS